MKRFTGNDVPKVVEAAASIAAAAMWVIVAGVAVSRMVGGDAPDAAVAAEASRDASMGTSEGPLQAALKAVQARNVFAPPKPEGFQGQLTGILGDKAVFNGSQRAGVGESVMGAKVLALGADWVEIEFEGATRRMQLFGGGSPGPRNGPRNEPGRAGPSQRGPKGERRK